MIRTLVPMAHVWSVPESTAFCEKLGFEVGNTFVLAPRYRLVPLRLLSSRRFSDGVVRLHYSVGDRPKRRAP